MLNGFPIAYRGQKVGLLGGSFDPPHAGHLHITHQALRRFRLDWVWWLVSPGNPIKNDAPATLERRIGAARGIVAHPRVQVTDIETRLGTRFTAHTIVQLQSVYPGVRFVWLMGADNLIGFHRWDRWQTILDSVPVGVLARPGQQLRAGLSPVARAYARFRLPQGAGRILATQVAPAWILAGGPMVEVSSTEIRASGEWVR